MLGRPAGTTGGSTPAGALSVFTIVLSMGEVIPARPLGSRTEGMAGPVCGGFGCCGGIGSWAPAIIGGTSRMAKKQITE
jgi:hypothetical protein